jgi:hypothetical protein
MRIHYLLTIIYLLLSPLLLKAQWIGLSIQSGKENFSVSFINKDIGYVAGGIWQGPPPGVNSTYLYRTTDGTSFLPVFVNSTNTPIQQMKFFTENVGVLKRWQDDVLKTVDAGMTLTQGNFTSSRGNMYKFQAIDSSTYLYYADTSCYYTVNGGNIWNQRMVHFPGAPPVFHFAIYGEFKDLKNGFIWTNLYYPNAPSPYSELNVFTTHDSAKTLTWSYSKKYKGYSSTDAALKMINSNEAILAVGSKLLRTGDFGLTWNTVFVDTDTTSDFYELEAKDQFILAGGYKGRIVKSEDGGQSFVDFDLPSPFYIRDIAIASTKPFVAYVANESATIYKTDVATALNDGPPAQSSRVSIYPNPFSEDVTVYLTIEKVSTVSIDVYSVLGENVVSLQKEFLQAGSHTIQLPFSEQALPPGVYVVKTTIDHSPVISRIVKMN